MTKRRIKDVAASVRQRLLDNARAFEKTFANRGTTISGEPVALSQTFASDPTKQAQWNGFLRKSRLDLAVPELDRAVEAIADFLKPVAEAVRKRMGFNVCWQAPGPWTAMRTDAK